MRRVILAAAIPILLLTLATSARADMWDVIEAFCDYCSSCCDLANDWWND